MNNDTKLILVILAIIVILGGVFIWKVMSPQKESTETVNKIKANVEDENENMQSVNITEQTVTNQNIKEDLNNLIENSAIIMFLQRALEESEMTLKIIRTIFLIDLGITVIVFFIKNTSPNSKINKKLIISLVITSVIFGINTFSYSNRVNAIEYAIQHKSWYIEKDTVKQVKKDSEGTYVYLKNHGKQQISSFLLRYDERR